ncbi:MAG: polyribonucleotide nucleotidyltransferase [Candidatus Pacebacteria bacterium]|nr:polyribonucleotide nucleotidyltransferase [Candidatus Paceibacterota bacterium]
MEKFEIEIGGKKIEFESKGLAKRANGEIMAKCGDTQVFTTCVMSSADMPEMGFFPLTVNYQEKYYAAGKILGSRFMRREGRPSDNAVIISRIIDRAIRPIFDKNIKREVQIISACFSLDKENDPDILGLLGASLALSLSDIPWPGPIGAVRIGIKNNNFIVNPTYEERQENSLDIIFTGVERNGEILINMLEADADEINQDLVLQAFEKAVPEIKKLIEFQKEIINKFGKEKVIIEKRQEPELEKRIQNFLSDKIEKILFNKQEKSSIEKGFEKAEKINKLKQELIESLKSEYPDKEQTIKDFFEKQTEKLIQKKALKNQRVDGRRLDEVRNIDCEVGLISRTHGSALFSRGATTALSILTLGGPDERQLIEGMEITMKKRFLHHYNFPPYSVGEVGRMFSPSRREIGHGVLVEKAIFEMIPKPEEFPYTIRIVSEMLCSNGSTSMASVCASSLALMDAGVPIKGHIAGIAIGLVQDKENYKLLTDIQGPEDFFGNMDFKITGTKNGITAIQLDVKISGISKKIFKEALEAGKKARLEILGIMEKTISKSRDNLSSFAPKILQLQIPIKKIGEVIGPKGQTIKKITEETGCNINIEQNGLLCITSEDEKMANEALATIKSIVKEIEVGEEFLGIVKKILNFGVFVWLEGKKEGMLPISQLKKSVKVGDKIPVQVQSIDDLGRINLSQKKITNIGCQNQNNTKK